ncbi:myosin-13-like isoform X2 [Xenia sp. Carnegie-2017]|uniref:myosin-13-like isoform X2 n=1 Tax=Xenia sp. Carnegie-2017 TaxID=2897299 RepID=UPI001F036544|nr:myosin-13-like isoform X2 [Xenia sp. Carnegie-2017]
MERLRVVKEKEDESFARSKKLQSLLSQSDGNALSSDVDDFAETKAERSLTDKHRTFVEGVANSAVIEIQKAQSRGHLAGRSKEIKQRQLEAKADLEAVRSRTTKLNEPVLTASTNLGTYSAQPNKVSVSTGNEKAELNPRFEESSDWSASSEDERDRRMSPAKTPLSGGETGLGSNLSPGLSASRPLLLHTPPLLSSSPAIIDNSPALMQLRSSLRENKRQLEKAQEKFTLADAKAKQLESHSDDLQSKLEEAINQKSVVERELFELNEENRLLKHECLKSVEDKKIAEALIGTVRDQMKRSEEKLTKEMKLRRAVEESGKKLESERANMENALRHIAQENEDIKKLLEREKEQCRLKDELYREQKKRNEAILLESQKVSQNRSEMLARLENADEDRKSVEASSESFKEQLIHAKGEIGRLTSQLESLSKASQNELELFKNQLHQQNERNRRLEESLTRVRSDYDSQMTQMQSANFEQQNKLESEMSNRHSLQSEVMLLRSKLENTENEREEAHKTRMDAERQLHASRDELYKTKNSLEKELSSVKEAGRMTTLKLNTADNKISSLEAELQTANVMLAERTSQMTMNMHDIESKRSSIGKLEADLREEKDKNSRITARLETATYKIKDLENEESNLRRQLDFAMEKVRRQEENSQETEKKLNSTISEMKTDYEKTKGKVSENEQRLAGAVEKYKEEMKQNFQKLQEKDEYARLLSQELAETAQKLSLAESSLEIQKKTRDSLEEERDHLRQTLRTYEEQMTVKISENQLVNGHATTLKNELEHSRKVSEETNQRLATTAYDLENLEKIKVDLQEDVAKLKGERVKLEATLQEEKAKTNLLLKEIKESNEGRSHLESLLSEIKSSNINLEEKLRVESIDKIQLAREADEAKNLWESEVRARSKVGAKILEMEAKVEEWKAALEEEKKKTRKALEGRKVIKGKLDIYEKRANQHEKEVQTLKTQAKTYKRRLKDVLSGEKSPTVLQAQFNRDIQQYEAMISTLRNQLREANDKLREESDLRISTERKGQQLEEDLEFSKAHSKDLSRQVQKLQRKNGLMADEMQELKAYFAENCVEKTQLDQMKLDLEAKSRIELNRKLADVNTHLEEQALAREALERSRNEQEDFRIKDLEETISKLRKENDEYRSRLHLLEAKKDTVEAEAERLKTKDLLLESVDRELSKSIKRHLDTIPANDPLDWWASKNFDYSSSPLSTSNRQYLETLKRKYFV